MNIKKTIIKLKWLPSAVYNRSIMKLRNISYGKKLITYGTIFIRGTGKISLGKHVTITSCRETNPIGGDVKTILFAKGDAVISIGDYSGISNTSIVAMNKVEIEDHVMIGGNCKIYDHDFHSINYEQRMMLSDPGIQSAAIQIKTGAFIGAHSIILKGVTIGKRSVVGAGSVVTKPIPDDEIWAGNPAKFVKKIVK